MTGIIDQRGHAVHHAHDTTNGGEHEPERAAFAALLNDPRYGYRALTAGTAIDGTYLGRDGDALVVDIGSKSEGIVPASERTSLTHDEVADLEPGDALLVVVVQEENADGQTVLSLDKARQELRWRELQGQQERNETISAIVSSYNKGGLLVILDGVRGFVPASQVSAIRGGDPAGKEAEMFRLVGQTFQFKVIEVDRPRNRLILSERQATQESRNAAKEQLLTSLHAGDRRTGRVSALTDFGAFIDLGGGDGLVHLSEIAWNRVKHPRDILKVGQEVEVVVLGVNREEKKIALSMRRAQPEPWTAATERFAVGQIVPALITQVTAFGAFAQLTDGVEGLIHKTEIGEAVDDPRAVIRDGQSVRVRILRIDPAEHRIGLSLRGVEQPDGEGEGAGEGQDGDTDGTTGATAAAAPETADRSAAPEAADRSAAPVATGTGEAAAAPLAVVRPAAASRPAPDRAARPGPRASGAPAEHQSGTALGAAIGAAMEVASGVADAAGSAASAVGGAAGSAAGVVGGAAGSAAEVVSEIAGTAVAAATASIRSILPGRADTPETDAETPRKTTPEATSETTPEIAQQTKGERTADGSVAPTMPS